jgi:hypothetical protein
LDGQPLFAANAALRIQRKSYLPGCIHRANERRERTELQVLSRHRRIALRANTSNGDEESSRVVVGQLAGKNQPLTTLVGSRIDAELKATNARCVIMPLGIRTNGQQNSPINSLPTTYPRYSKIFCADSPEKLIMGCLMK